MMIRSLGRTTVATIVLVVGVSLTTIPAGAEVEPIPVLTTPATERHPVAMPGYLAWSGRAHVYVRADAGSPVRVNDVDTHGALGGFTGSSLVYQQYSTGTSDIYLYDLASGARTRIGRPVSTNEWEYFPSMSGPWLMFGRWHRNSNRDLMLYNVRTDAVRLITTSAGPRWLLLPGQVNGDYATFESLRWDQKERIVGCDVFRYQISTGSTWPVPNRRGICQYGPSVSTTGTVYYGRSGMVCGHRAAIRAQQPGDPWRRVVSLPAGWDFGTTFTLVEGGTASIFFDLSVCGEDDDIYVVADDGAPAAVPALPSPEAGWRRVPTANIPPAAHP